MIPEFCFSPRCLGPGLPTKETNPGGGGGKGQGEKGQGEKGQGEKGQGEKGQGEKGQGEKGLPRAILPPHPMHLWVVCPISV